MSSPRAPRYSATLHLHRHCHSHSLSRERDGILRQELSQLLAIVGDNQHPRHANALVCSGFVLTRNTLIKIFSSPQAFSIVGDSFCTAAERYRAGKMYSNAPNLARLNSAVFINLKKPIHNLTVSNKQKSRSLSTPALGW